MKHIQNRLWAKKNERDLSFQWLPLFVHLEDTARVMDLLWEQWASDALKIIITENCFIDEIPLDDSAENKKKIRALLRFLGASHDLGKATPIFQLKGRDTPLRSALRKSLEEIDLLKPDQLLADFTSKKWSPHALAGEQLLMKAGVHENIAYIVGSHHGKPSTEASIKNGRPKTCPQNYFGSKKNEGQNQKWKLVQANLLQRSIEIAEVKDAEELPIPNMVAQVILSGLLVMADWIASNERFFPYRDWSEAWDDLREPEASRRRAEEGFNVLNLPQPKPTEIPDVAALYRLRFGDGETTFKPYPMQEKALELAASIKAPGLFVIEAGMGQGKTEAALVIAELFAAQCGASGVFFALPTQSTSNGIFPRIERWLERLSAESLMPQSIHLVHGKAQFNDFYRQLQDEPENNPPNASGITEDDLDSDAWVSVHSWFNGNKKGLLDHFVVGTIDQLLLAALKQKHFMLRHLGLVNKIVIIDEAHAFDAYMNTYLERALEWLGAYHVPVIVLSATLPKETREKFARAYLRGRDQCLALAPKEEVGKNAYPRFTFSNGQLLHQGDAKDQSRAKTVYLKEVKENDLQVFLGTLLSEGGCVGIIVNTVKMAQSLYIQLKALYPEEELMLLHSQYLPSDRMAKETELVDILGKNASAKRPYRRIIIGTQIFEQSLDIDFDMMITELCPVDLLLQRIGRLQRFNLERPQNFKEAKCYILQPDETLWNEGSERIYGGYLLRKTQSLLQEKLELPKDIPHLVQATYENDTDDKNDAELIDLFDRYSSILEGKKIRASSYSLRKPDKDLEETLLGMTEAAPTLSNSGAEAKVRDADPSLEVLAARVDAEGNILFHDQGKAYKLYYGKEPYTEEARALARQQLRLPRVLCLDYGHVGNAVLDHTIAELEALNRTDYSWLQASSWLRGELFLPFDEAGHAHLNGYELIYDCQLGLRYKKEGADAGERV